MRIMLAEDDRQLRQSVTRGLREAAYTVDQAGTGSQALTLAATKQYDAIILDVLLPGDSGIVVCRSIRERGDRVPILMLTALDSVEQRIAGLDAGADDYLTKPFDFAELAARVRALLRRPENARSPLLTVADIELDPAAHTVRRNGVMVPLTAREFALLHYMMDRQGDVISRSDLLDAVWDTNYDGLSNVVDVHVANLRRKLELPSRPAPIETIRGVGYRIGDPETAGPS